jgi:hypothetical protein
MAFLTLFLSISPFGWFGVGGFLRVSCFSPDSWGLLLGEKHSPFIKATHLATESPTPIAFGDLPRPYLKRERQIQLLFEARIETFFA